jgi:hypothetical protein
VAEAEGNGAEAQARAEEPADDEVEQPVASS